MEYYKLRYLGFDWDQGNYQKAQKHGLRIQEIEEVFQQNLIILADKKRILSEIRYLAVGEMGGRGVFIAFTIRKQLIRVISARYMHHKEKLKYDYYKEQKGKGK